METPLSSEVELPDSHPEVATQSVPAVSGKAQPAARNWLGNATQWRLALWRPLLPKIAGNEQLFSSLSDKELRKKSLELQFRAKSGQKLATLLPEAFALARVAAQRTLNMRHYDVQLLGGIALFHGCVAEMQTGEGKTLTATLPLYLHALRGKGAHIATVNDYLAKRDAEWMMPVFEKLGLTVGIIQSQMLPDQRRSAYQADITYGTAKEFGFDFLRDRLLSRRLQEAAIGLPMGMAVQEATLGDEKPVQRTAQFALVDEADSVLIDDARTPLIISALPGPAQQRIVDSFVWAADVASQFEEESHYEYDHEKRTVELTFQGRQLVRSLPKHSGLDDTGFVDLYDYIERAIKVGREFHRDQHYIIREGEIVIVDEATGRIAEGRKWSRGIHQAVEAKESVEVTVDSGQAARITVQDFFLRYENLAGMTGTGITSSYEFRKIYHLPVLSIPTNRPSRRQRLPEKILSTTDAKWQSIVEEVSQMYAISRPVLIGTRTIEDSEQLSQRLSEQQIPHLILNAHQVAEEAEIVAQAGQPNRVTVATNMAGRGTDIQLGETVTQLGGLHVICTEMHESARIDRQLIGRCARQGDPGTYRIYMSLEDSILKSAYKPQKVKRICAGNDSEASNLSRMHSLFRKAQRLVERRHYRQRMVLLHHEKQLKKLHKEMGQDPYLESPH